MIFFMYALLFIILYNLLDLFAIGRDRHNLVEHFKEVDKNEEKEKNLIEDDAHDDRDNRLELGIGKDILNALEKHKKVDKSVKKERTFVEDARNNCFKFLEGNYTFRGLEEVDKDGNTVLHWAVFHKRDYGTLEMLHKNAPFLGARNNNGKTALDIAVESNFGLAAIILHNRGSVQNRFHDDYANYEGVGYEKHKASYEQFKLSQVNALDYAIKNNQQWMTKALGGENELKLINQEINNLTVQDIKDSKKFKNLIMRRDDLTFALTFSNKENIYFTKPSWWCSFFQENIVNPDASIASKASQNQF